MTTHPPHLPKKSSSIIQYKMIQHVPWLLFFVGVCALTAIAMSMALFAWYIPSYVSYYVPAGVQRTIAVPQVTDVDPLFIKDLESKMVEIHRGNSESPPSTVSERSLVAHAMLLSSDGWVAFAGGVLDEEDNLFALDASGNTYALSRVQTDTVPGIVYAKISGDGFRVMPIETGNPSASIYIKEGDTWSAQLLAESVSTANDGADAYLHLPAKEYPVDAAAGSIAIAANGGVVGFVSDGRIIPAWWIQESLHAILSETPVEHAILPYTYRPVHAVYDTAQQVYRAMTGLEITTAPASGSTSTLAVGDVIVRFDGAPVHPTDIAERIQKATAPYTFDVYRSGSMITVVLE